MTKLAEIEGIGDAYAGKLAGAGLLTQEQLLEAGADPAGRKSVAERTGIPTPTILKWCNRADLARVKGIGGEYADLLEHAGVDTVPELAQRDASNLHDKLIEVNSEKKLVRALPSTSQVEGWVEQARGLPRALHY